MSTIHHPADHAADDAAHHGDDHGDGPADEPTAVALPDGPVGVSVHHDPRGPVLLALVCAVLTVVWFARALATSSALDWALTLVPAAVGVLMLALLRDARAPLLVADDDGVRVRRGSTWTGLRWHDVDSVEIRGRRGLADGALVLHLAAQADDMLGADDDTDPVGEPAAREVSVPLGVGTRVEVEGLTGDLVEDLASLASGRVPVRVLAQPVPASAQPTDEMATDEQADETATDEQTDEQAFEQVEVAEVVDARAAEVVTEKLQVVVLPADSGVALPEQVGPADAADAVGAVDATDDDDPAHQTDAGHAGIAEDAGDDVDSVAAPVPYVAGLAPDRPTRGAARAQVVREGGRRMPDTHAIPAQRAADIEVVTARIEDVAVEAGPQPAADPVIGPVVAAARHRARLTVDTLSERTRIRPHVIECIEVDDFAPCGGDFYARGHLRTLARVFGLDAEELVATYDARYAQPEIEAKQVFEAELASGVGGGLRTTSSGPRWSMLAAAVVVLVGIWGTARVFSDSPEELVSPAPDVVDTAGLAGQQPAETETALGAVRVTAEGASPQVVVRDAGGRILWSGQLGEGSSQQVVGTAPFDVTASNGRAVRVDYLGRDRGTVGTSDAADNRRFG